jgi:hypothetical protein
MLLAARPIAMFAISPRASRSNSVSAVTCSIAKGACSVPGSYADPGALVNALVPFDGCRLRPVTRPPVGTGLRSPAAEDAPAGFLRVS